MQVNDTASFTNQAGGVFDLTTDNADITADTSGDTATFDNAGMLEKTGGAGVSRIAAAVTNTGTIMAASGTLEFDDGGNFGGAISGTGTVAFAAGNSTLTALASASLLVDGGTLVGSSAANVTGAFTATRGVVSIAAGQTLALPGSTSFGINGNYGPSVEGPGTLLTSGAVSLVAQTGGDFTDLYVGDGAAWTNSATVTDAGLIQFGVKANDTASFTNQAGGVFDLTTDNADITIYTSGDTATFDNAGVLEKTGGTGVSAIAAAVTNTGTIMAASGTLEFDDGGNFGGAISGTGTVAFAAGNSTLTALASASLLVDGGTLVGSSAANVTGAFTATRGVVSIAAGQTLALPGSTSFGINGNYGPSVEGPGTLLTSGAVSLVAQSGGDFTDLYVGDGAAWTNSATVTDAGLIQFGVKANDTASFTNQASGVFDLTTDNADITIYTSGDTATFDNAGVLEKTGGTGVSAIAAAVTNTGTIMAASGTLEFDGGGNFGGAISGSGTVAFAAGNSTLTALASASLLVDGGTLVGSSAANVTGAFTATRGVVSIAAGQTLTLPGSTSFGINGNYGPSIEGPGTLLTSGVVSLVAQTGGDYTDLYVGDGAAWTNSATVTDAGLIQFGVKANDTASFTNQAGGVFDLTTDNADITAYASGDTATFDNAGVLEKTGGTGVSTVAAAITNSDLIATLDGTLLFTGTINNLGAIHAATGSAVDITGTLTGDGNIVIDGGSKVEIAHTNSAAVIFTGAGTLQLDSPAGFIGTITGMVAGSEITFGGAQAISTSVRNSVLTVDFSNGTSAELSINGALNTGDFTLSGNTLTATTQLGTPSPDLIVNGVSVAASALAGEPISIIWTDTNQGNISAAGPWTDEVFLVSSSLGSNPTLLGTLTINDTLAAGLSQTQTLDVTLPAATSGNQWILVKTDALNQVPGDGTGPERQEVSSAVDVIPTGVQIPPLKVSHITPDYGSNLGSVTMTIVGAQFNANETVEVIGSGGTTLDATTVDWVSGSELWATFNLQGLAVGTYTVEVSDANRSVSLPDALQVNNGPAGTLSVNLSLPQTISGATGTGTVSYTNTGSTDIAAPILGVSSTQALLQAPGDTAPSGTSKSLAPIRLAQRASCSQAHPAASPSPLRRPILRRWAISASPPAPPNQASQSTGVRWRRSSARPMWIRRIGTMFGPSLSRASVQPPTVSPRRSIRTRRNSARWGNPPIMSRRCCSMNCFRPAGRLPAAL